MQVADSLAKITGGTPRKSVGFRVSDGRIGKRDKLLRQLGKEAYAERTLGMDERT